MSFRDDFVNAILTLPMAKVVSGERTITLRCRYCPDSRNPNHTHMSITIPDGEKPILFNCFKCHTSGIVTADKLVEWGIYNAELLINVTKYNNSIFKSGKVDKRFIIQNCRLNNTFITDNKITQYKLLYLNKRLGTNLSLSDMSKFKICLNIIDVLNENNIRNLTREENVVQELNKYFLGFISVDNAFINNRCIIDYKKMIKPLQKRYVNYNIFGKYDNTKRFYVLPTNINLDYPERIKINIAEGPMDILSIYNNLHTNHFHNIYASILGSSYFSLIKYFLLTLKLNYVEFHIYPDNDIPDEVFFDINNFLKFQNISLIIHRNMMEGEKDFGVKKEKIKEIIYKIE